MKRPVLYAGAAVALVGLMWACDPRDHTLKPCLANARNLVAAREMYALDK